MTISPELTKPEWLSRVPPVASGFAVASGLITLAGYASRERSLVTVLPGSVPMAANTAVLFVLTGVSLWLVSPLSAGPLRRRAGQGLALAVVLLATLILLQYFTDRGPAMDLLLFPDQARQWSGKGIPGRFSPHTGAAFLVTGLALALLDADARHRHRYARLLAPTAAVLAGVGLVGRAFGLQYLYGSVTMTGMALNTAVTFVVVSAGLLACRADRPLARLFAGQGLGGMTMRRLIPVVFAAILLAGVLFSATRGGDHARSGFGLTAAVMILVVTLCVVFVRTGKTLNDVDRGQRALLASLRDEHAFNEAMLQSLPDGVVALAPDGTVLQVSNRWSEITGFSEQDAVGRTPPYPWWPAEQPTRAPMSEVRMRLRRPDGAEIDVVRSTHPVLDADGGLRMVVGTVRDVTASTRAAAEQLRQAEQLTHYFDLSTDLMCIAGTDGYFKRLNPAWSRALGYSDAELTACPYVEFVHPDDVARTDAETREQVAKGKASVSFENRFRCRDGSYRWLQWNAIPRGDLVYAVARDTTAQRKAADDQARLAAIVDSTDDAIISENLDGVITGWNPAAERIYGHRRDQAVGQSIRIIFGPEHDETLRRVGRGEVVTNRSSTRLRADGTEIHIGLTISPIRDSAGTVVGAASIARDTTAHHKAEERFRRLIEAAPDAMMLADTGGTIVLANEQTERLFGYQAAELVGQPVEMLMPADARGRHQGHRTAFLNSPSARGMGTGMELSGLRRNGTEFPVEISLAPLDTDQGALVCASIRDVSARKQIERDLATARDDALAAAQIKSQFVAMVSHEIRTPMNGVIGLTVLLLNTPLDPTQRRYAEAIRASGRALLSIINDILDFSKIEYGKIVLSEADFVLVDLLEEVVQVAAEAGRDKNLQIQAAYPPDLPARVRGDEGRLRQVLLNLLGNAVKFTEHGEVLLRVGAGDPDRPYDITFAVTDTGIGITPHHLAGIFEPFSQVDAATNREFGGTGLGLSICDQLVKLMGGRLEVTSEPGQGSRFSFTAALGEAGEAPPPRSSSGSLSGRRLLVIDGNDSRRTMLAEHCGAWGLTTATATDGRGALAELREATARRQPYEVALLDHRLDDIEGTRLAQEIAADPAIGTPILILLTSGSYQDEQVAVAAGAAAALPKPVGPSQLYNSLIQLLDLRTDHVPQPLTEGPVASGHGLVLLAEDNAINRLVAVDTLEMLGYRVDVARNGVEALELASLNTYQAVLMDCQMPKMDGYAATATLRSREGEHRHTPVIAMTAGALSEDRERCLAAGMDDYLSKPIDAEQLNAALERWINGLPADPEKRDAEAPLP